MYNLVIVDDELKTLKILARSINWEKYGFNLAKTFTDAGEALDYVRSHPVELIISDIYMPDINGIDLLKKLQLYANPPIFIILSAFREFEYAQEALRLGAFDYITKPVTEEKFSQSLSRAKAELDKNIQNDRTLNIKHLLIEGIFNKTLTDSSIIANMVKKSDLETEPGPVPAVVIKASFLDSQKYYDDNAETYSTQQFKNSIYNLFEITHPNIVIYNYSYNFIYFAIISPYRSYTDFFAFIKDILGEISNTALEILNTEFTFDIYHILSDVFVVTQHCFEIKQDTINNIVEAANHGKHSKITEFFNMYCNDVDNNIDGLKLFFFSLLILFDTKLGLSYKTVEIEGIICSTSQKNILSGITKLIDISTVNGSAKLENKSNDIIVNTQKYIQQHFKDNISMTTIAKDVHVSVSYLSRLFKQTTGQSIVYYIKNVRLQYAKELLLTTEDSIESIAFSSGYRSRNLFNSDFKAKYGETPRNFKNNLTKEMNRLEN